MNAQEERLADPVHDAAPATDDLTHLTIEAWMRQVVASPSMRVYDIAKAMQADGLGEAEAYVLAALGMLKHDATPLSAVRESSRLQDAIWALLQHFRQARADELAPAVTEVSTAPARPVSPHLLEQQVVLCDGRSIHVRATCRHPDLALFDNVLSAQECDALIELAGDRIVPSKVMEAEENVVDAAFRSSSGSFLPAGSSTLLADLQARIAELTQWPADRQEDWALARYLPGQQFKAHWDYFDADPTKSNHRDAMADGGQRIGTVVLYLSDVPSGGGTVFDFAGLEVRPRKGSAVYFAYQLPDGDMDVSSLHCAAPVGEGEKWIASVWLRERPVAR